MLTSSVWNVYFVKLFFFAPFLLNFSAQMRFLCSAAAILVFLQKVSVAPSSTLGLSFQTHFVFNRQFPIQDIEKHWKSVMRFRIRQRALRDYIGHGFLLQLFGYSTERVQFTFKKFVPKSLNQKVVNTPSPLSDIDFRYRFQSISLRSNIQAYFEWQEGFQFWKREVGVTYSFLVYTLYTDIRDHKAMANESAPYT